MWIETFYHVMPVMHYLICDFSNSIFAKWQWPCFSRVQHRPWTSIGGAILSYQFMATAVGMPLGCIRCFSGMGLDLISPSGQPEYYFFGQSSLARSWFCWKLVDAKQFWRHVAVVRILVCKRIRGKDYYRKSEPILMIGTWNYIIRNFGNWTGPGVCGI